MNFIANYSIPNYSIPNYSETIYILIHINSLKHKMMSIKSKIDGQRRSYRLQVIFIT